MDLNFVRLQTEHLDRILEIENVSFPEPWTRSMFEREISLPISHFSVAVQDGTLVGYGGYWLIHDEAHIVNLAVHPDRRGRGTGRCLLEHLLAEIAALPVVRILLEVRKNNEPARKLYAACGFAVVGVRPKYYNHTEDAILMERTVQERKTGEAE